MFCDGCGAQLQNGQRFCPNCGKPIAGAATLGASRSETGGHVKLLGILWLAISAVRLVPALAILGMLQSNFYFLPPDVPSFVPHLISLFGLILLGGGLLGVTIGWGLLTWQPWARMAAIVFGCISLLEVPFGTAIGIYTLWALLPEQSRREYQARSLASNGI
jgi:hypothetical protein